MRDNGIVSKTEHQSRRDGGFSTGGYATGFVEEWLKNRKKPGIIFWRHGGSWMTEAAWEALREQLE